MSISSENCARSDLTETTVKVKINIKIEPKNDVCLMLLYQQSSYPSAWNLRGGDVQKRRKHAADLKALHS